MNLENKHTIADSLKPTFENVTREFITQTLYKILFSDKLPNFRFDFREAEAIEFIEEILKDYSNQYDFHKKDTEKVLQAIKEKSNGNTSQAVMVVKDYKMFFELLRQLYERDIELFFLRTKISGFPVYEKNNCFEQIWLRATPDDFNNPERFLKKQVSMIKDKTFEEYDSETYLGELDFLDNNIICVKNDIARTWDENSREFKITIYDKKYYNTKMFYKPNYALPVIRYGIYEENCKKICYIGSIQNKSNDYEENDLRTKINRKKYKVNTGVPEEEVSKVEPKHILALSIFINFIHSKGITEIEVPSMYVLDHEYHSKRNKEMLKMFEEDWPEERRLEEPELYRLELYHFNQNYGKEDLISELKTERLLLTFKRLLHHYPNGVIRSYPGELDSFLHLSIPIVKSENEINGDMLKYLYRLVSEKLSENER